MTRPRPSKQPHNLACSLPTSPLCSTHWTLLLPQEGTGWETRPQTATSTHNGLSLLSSDNVLTCLATLLLHITLVTGPSFGWSQHWVLQQAQAQFPHIAVEGSLLNFQICLLWREENDTN